MCQFLTVQTFFYADASDEPTGELVHLPRNLLGGNAQKRIKRRRALAGTVDQETSSDEEDMLTNNWKRRDPGLVGSKVPDIIRPELPPEVIEAAASYNAYDYYKLFQPDSFVDTVVEQSKLYGGQKDMAKQAEMVNVNTYR